MDNLRENKPTADILMTSMRAMGYTFESANSIKRKLLNHTPKYLTVSVIGAIL